MSAAFALDYSGDPVGCDFKGCILDAWHDGDHQFAAPKPKFSPDRIHKCEICGLRFVIYGEHKEPSLASERRTCGSQECILALAHRDASELPVLCPCSQREYPHELSVHKTLKYEVWTPKGPVMRWPWSLYFLRNGGPVE